VSFRVFLIVAAVLIATSASASQPQGKEFGYWLVSSINSMDGGGTEGDAAAGIYQEHGENRLFVDWDQGSRITVSAEFDDCFGKNDDFTAIYYVDVEHWLNTGRKMEQRIAEDFRVWLKQTRFACIDQTRINLFNLKKIKSAVRDFSVKLSYFSSSS